jgi:DNA polymerase-1
MPKMTTSDAISFDLSVPDRHPAPKEVVSAPDDDDVVGGGDVEDWAAGSRRMRPVSERFNLSEIEGEARQAAWSIDSVGALQTIPTPSKVGVRGEWDWSRDLSQPERARLARRYTSPGGMPPDVFAGVFARTTGFGDPDNIEKTIEEWLYLTRVADAGRLAERGRDLPPRAFGGLRLDDLFNPARRYEDEGEDSYPEDIRLYVHERDEGAFNEWANGIRNVGIDVETTAIKKKLGHGSIWQPGFRLRTVQVATKETAWVFDIADEDSRKVVTLFLADGSRTFVSHTSFDPLVIAVHIGIDLSRRYVNTWILAKLFDSSEWEWTGGYKENGQRKYRRPDSGLKALTVKYLKDTSLLEAEADLVRLQREHAPLNHRVGPRFDEWRWRETPVDLAAFVRYAGMDALNHLRLGHYLRGRIRAAGIPDSLVDDERWLEAECLAVTRRGIPLDIGTTTDRLAKVQDEMDELRAELLQATGIEKPTSPTFVDWLEEHGVTFRLDEKTESGRGSLKKSVLPAIVDRYRGDPVLGPILDARSRFTGLTNKRTNLRNFIDMADPAGRVHCEFKTVQAVTGRMSVCRPAMQTLRKGDAELRTCFTADSGNVVLSCDFDQVEIRVAAALSRDGALLEMIHSGKDVHGVTAARVFGEDFTDEQRGQSKTANFAILYGAGAPKIAKQLGLPVQVARQLRQAWRDSYPGLTVWSKRAENISPVVKTGVGRHIPVNPDMKYANGNYMIQSSARDLLVEALRRYLSDSAYADSLMLLLHDEIVVQVPRRATDAAAAWLESSMTLSFQGVPITAHVEQYGTHWAGPRDDDRLVEDEEEIEEESAA